MFPAGENGLICPYVPPALHFLFRGLYNAAKFSLGRMDMLIEAIGAGIVFGLAGAVVMYLRYRPRRWR